MRHLRLYTISWSFNGVLQSTPAWWRNPQPATSTSSDLMPILRWPGLICSMNWRMERDSGFISQLGFLNKVAITRDRRFDSRVTFCPRLLVTCYFCGCVSNHAWLNHLWSALPVILPLVQLVFSTSPCSLEVHPLSVVLDLAICSLRYDSRRQGLNSNNRPPPSCWPLGDMVDDLTYAALTG